MRSLDKITICHIHSLITKSCQYSILDYIPAEKTLAEIQKSVIVVGAYKIKCCPFPDVDKEVEYICMMAKVRVFVPYGFFSFTDLIYLLGFYFFVAMGEVITDFIPNSELDSSGTCQVPSVRSIYEIYLSVYLSLL